VIVAGKISDVRYILISPCRDEAGFARRTIESVLRQTKPPDVWIVVDDGSTDGTEAILEEYARTVRYLRVVRLRRPGGRRVGRGVVEAFNAGLRCVEPRQFKYLCKLDLDLELPPGYFEGLIRRMEADPRLGTCSGKAYYRSRGNLLVSEGVGNEMSIGATKFYRTDCFLDIGGFVPEIMWDGIDCHRCRMKGWSARSFSDVELRFLHLRPMGSSQGGLWSGRWRHGLGQWFMGTGFIFMTTSAIYRMTRRPFIIGGLAMWLGYLAGLVTRAPRYADPEFRAFLRRYQRNCLLVGKRRATKLLEG
jgi:poly-beta-1,6-N-acetyl-D-glucosamine synthase